MIANPTALRSLLKHEDVEKHRSLSCGKYDGCLDTALRRSWNGWTCKRCGLFPLTRALHAAEVCHQAALRPLA